jgi:glutamate-1-semialdehyde 2,1-aminomutase
VSRSKKLFDRAQRSIPGGVNSPVRAFRSVGGDPPFLARAAGARVWDADGREYVDYVGSWGPMILGHAHPEVIDAIAQAARDGTSFGAPTEREVLFAEAVKRAFPSMELVRCVSSGTEATMSALRVARGFTGRDKVVKIDGGYHGHADLLLAEAGSGAATLGIPGSAGVPAGAAKDTIVVPWNDLDAMKAAFAANRGQLAALIVEPVPGNIGCVPARDGYLAALRELCTAEGVVLIFDEVITGFRIARGGAQERFGVRPDLTCLGKIVGGGLPAACFGGRAEIMSVLAPLGPVYQAGTLSGNPLAMAAGLKTMELLERPSVYVRLEALGARLEAGLRAAGATQVNRVGSMFTAFFAEDPVVDYASAKKSDTARFGRYFRAMLERGIYLAPSQFECGFLSLAHTDDDVDRTVAAAREAFVA